MHAPQPMSTLELCQQKLLSEHIFRQNVYRPIVTKPQSRSKQPTGSTADIAAWCARTPVYQERAPLERLDQLSVDRDVLLRGEPQNAVDQSATFCQFTVTRMPWECGHFASFVDKTLQRKQRKICRNCKCGQEEHDVLTSNEEDRKVGKLFEDTKYTTLIAKLKSDGIPMYKRNVMILTNPVSAKKNISINTVTYEWAPPVQNQTLARQYMQMLPKEKQPVAGSEGAQYRKKQLAKQLPAHDQDPSKCHELSPNEVKQMEQFVKKYKNEALGVGDVKFPSEVEAKATDKNNADHGDKSTSAAIGAMEDKSTSPKGSQYSCYCCKLDMKEGDPAVYAERAGYDKLWHPACFVCCTCSELLVDMIYFWKNGKLYCGRHYCDSEKPRCAGCDELIFSNEYTQAECQNWHLKHFCCFDCDCVLAGEIYVMVNDKPVCKPCYVKNHAVICQGCHNAIDPEVQRVTYNSFNWHATTECFLCSCCSKSLIGQKFMPIEGMVFCSVECKKKMMS